MFYNFPGFLDISSFIYLAALTNTPDRNYPDPNHPDPNHQNMNLEKEFIYILPSQVSLHPPKIILAPNI